VASPTFNELAGRRDLCESARQMGLSVPGNRQGSKHDRFLSLADTDRQSSERFLGKALNDLKDWEKPDVIHTDKAPTCGLAISELKAEGKCPENTVHL